MSSNTNNYVPDDMEIAPRHKVSEWKSLRLEDPNSPDWKKALSIFEERIASRFVEPIDVLIAHEIGHERGTFGFAILALDCLIVETLQGLREGLSDHSGKSQCLIVSFLTERSLFRTFFTDKEVADKFYSGYRCALHHSGKTDGNLRIQRHGPLLRMDGILIDINRTAFHEATKLELKIYLAELADSNKKQERGNFLKVMNAICGIEKPA